MGKDKHDWTGLAVKQGRLTGLSVSVALRLQPRAIEKTKAGGRGLLCPLAPSIHGLIFTHKLVGMKSEISGGDVGKALPAAPDDGDARLTIVFASEKATELRNPA